jgi:RNA polymerase sigma-70 factor, ECF subfamily
MAMKRPEDGELAGLVIGGGTPNPPARSVSTSFDGFYTREWSSVAALAHSLCGSWSAAEELAQDAFVAAYRNWDRVSRLERPEAWVRRVVVNAAVSTLRRRGAEARARLRLRATRPPGQAPVALASEQGEFWAAVRSLPKRQAQAVALHYLEDRSISEIATILECAENTVKVHLHRGRTTLAKRLHLEHGGSS